MSLKSEILALRAELRAQANNTAPASESADTGHSSDKPSVGAADAGTDIDTFLKAVNETLDEFADELDRFPRLTALAALGLGLAAGIVIGRQLR
ncbi:hypothetical protein [Ancylobacter sp. IITR112]|uniref:hypothetical protein n=1 Tax=Ancylobacter sp. IITR112 TaxID=3138073 RepID=UPI00352AF1D1